MSNYARVVVEIDKNAAKKFESILNKHPLKICIKEYHVLKDGNKVYDFNCNHYDRIEPNLEKCMYDKLDDEDWKLIGIDEYGHWEDGGMDCPHIWLDIIIED